MWQVIVIGGNDPYPRAPTGCPGPDGRVHRTRRGDPAFVRPARRARGGHDSSARSGAVARTSALNSCPRSIAVAARKTENREPRGRRASAKTPRNAFFKKAAWVCTCVRSIPRRCLARSLVSCAVWPRRGSPAGLPRVASSNGRCAYSRRMPPTEFSKSCVAVTKSPTVEYS